MVDLLAFAGPTGAQSPASSRAPSTWCAPAAPSRLTGPELAALQLVARGYSVDQVAGLRGCEIITVLWDLQRALTALRVRTVRQAIAAVRRRGLIV